MPYKTNKHARIFWDYLARTILFTIKLYSPLNYSYTHPGISAIGEQYPSISEEYTLLYLHTYINIQPHGNTEQLILKPAHTRTSKTKTTLFPSGR